MPTIVFKGAVSNAAGAAIILSATGENFDFSNTFDGSFSKGLSLPKGDYLVIITCMTDGEVEFNIAGAFTSVKPDVPETFDKDKTGNSYDLTV